jgi:hypothetical protein
MHELFEASARVDAAESGEVAITNCWAVQQVLQ